jgi:hypothetical protein
MIHDKGHGNDALIIAKEEATDSRKGCAGCDVGRREEAAEP